MGWIAAAYNIRVPIDLDTVCSSRACAQACGVVQESRIIDESSEWRNFSDKGDGTEDKSRVGGAGNPLIESKGELQKTGILSKSATGQV